MISFVQQPTDNSCTSACLSMLTRKNIDDIIDEFHLDFHSHKKTVYEFLDTYDFKYSVPSLREPVRDYLHTECLYLLTVPSLNIQGGLHHIVASILDGEFVVYDPQRGRKNKLYYIGYNDKIENELEVHVDLVISIKEYTF